MKETTLWRHIDHPLSAYGKFQKLSDRFTGGVPDALGSLRYTKGPESRGRGIPVAMELKELTGVRKIDTRFRPGQLDWLRDWEEGGGVSLILASWGHTVYGFRWELGEALEQGMGPAGLRDHCLFEFPKGPRGASWRDFVTFVLVPLLQAAAKGPTPYSMVSGVPLLLRPDLMPSQGLIGSGGMAMPWWSGCAVRKASRAR